MPCFRENCHSIFFWGVRKGWGGGGGGGLVGEGVENNPVQGSHIFNGNQRCLIHERERAYLQHRQIGLIPCNEFDMLYKQSLILLPDA